VSGVPDKSLPTIDGAIARAIVEDSIRTYFRKRRSRVPAFVDETFSFAGAWKTHSRAFGHDLWRAPLNIVMAAPQLGLDAIANGLARAGRKKSARWLKSRELFFRTTVTEEVERRIIVDLLGLPYDGPGRPSFSDALAIEILDHEQLAGAFGTLAGTWGSTERARIESRLLDQISIYLNARAAAGEVVGATMTVGAGALLVHRFTPGMLTFGPAVAEAISARVAGATAALVAGSAAFAASVFVSAYAGLITDPIQRLLGFHQARLIRLLDTLEDAFLGGDAQLRVPEQYAARLVDLLDAVASVVRPARITP
jgi:uncharacterized protein DUF6635